MQKGIRECRILATSQLVVRYSGRILRNPYIEKNPRKRGAASFHLLIYVDYAYNNNNNNNTRLFEGSGPFPNQESPTAFSA